MSGSEELMRECEDSMVRVVYQYPDSDREDVRRNLLFCPAKNQLILEKEVSVGQPAVYEYLRTHRNVHIPRVFQWRICDAKEGDDPQKSPSIDVMEEFIGGRTLEEILSSGETVSDEEKRNWVLQLLDGLYFLHHAEPKIIHRDVKAANIMITDDGILKLIDYDAAKVYRENEKRDTVLLGTDGSAAPEQYGFAQSDERTDIYAVGKLILRLFPEDDRMRKIGRKASMMDPEDRYRGVEELKKAITEQEGTLRDKDWSPWPIPGFRSGKVWKMMIACAGYAAMISLSFSLSLEKSGTPARLWIERIAFLICMLGSVDVCCQWSPVGKSLPGCRSANGAVRALSRIGWSVGWFVLIIFLLSIFPAGG